MTLERQVERTWKLLAATPVKRLALLMRYCEDSDSIRKYAIDQRVRESSKRNASNIPAGNEYAEQRSTRD
jgi:hypothetical protein